MPMKSRLLPNKNAHSAAILPNICEDEGEYK
jgi:hypothetical protein